MLDEQTLAFSLSLRIQTQGRLADAVCPLSALQEMGGWESIEMVQCYAHLAPNHLTQHAMQIDAFLAGNGTNIAQGAFAELVNIA